MNKNNLPTLQDFSLIRSHIDKIKTDYSLSEKSFGIYYLGMDLILNLQQDEIEDSLTDTAYLKSIGASGGHDRGIDAVYIDDGQTPAKIYLFNFKYTDKFEKSTNNFPSGEIDKILSFLESLMSHDQKIKNDINDSLYEKVKDIWELFNKQNPAFEIIFCSNHFNSIEKLEKDRFQRSVARYSNFSIEYFNAHDFVKRLTKKGRIEVNGKIRAIDKNLFEKSDGDIRALIVDVDIRDIFRIVSTNEDFRNNADIDNFVDLKEYEILEDAFEDNVRVYLKQRSKINRNIKETALSDEAYRLFYFNNGITITCSHFDYPKQRRSAIIELQNLQIVNGSQSIHALFDAFRENEKHFVDMDILCRIYQTKNEKLSTSIAEYTNSQNPVQSRDIRSNDYMQKKLQTELKALGYYYERKKLEFPEKPKPQRIDAEKAGQALLAFINQMPAQAKDQKRTIFAERYDEIFTDTIVGDTIILIHKLFENIEKNKLSQKRKMLQDSKIFEEESFITHATYYILYTLSKLTEMFNIEKLNSNFSDIINHYDKAYEIVKKSVVMEKDSLEGYKDSYTHRGFFKRDRPKEHIKILLQEVKSKT